VLTCDTDIAILSVYYVPVLYQNGICYHYIFFSLKYNHYSFLGTKHLCDFWWGHPLWGM